MTSYSRDLVWAGRGRSFLHGLCLQVNKLDGGGSERRGLGGPKFRYDCTVSNHLGCRHNKTNLEYRGEKYCVKVVASPPPKTPIPNISPYGDGVGIGGFIVI